MSKINLLDLKSVSLKPPAEPTVVRNSFFFVKDTTPDPKPAWIIPNKLAVGSQDCACAEETKTIFTHCVNVGFDLANAFENDGVVYKKLNVSDVEDFDMVLLFEELHSFIDAAIGTPQRGDKAKKSPAVLIHCNAGVSRSVTVAASYLMLVKARRGEDPNLDQCLEEIKTVRPGAKPNPGFITQLCKWELLLRDRFTYHFSHEDSVRERNVRLIQQLNSCGDLQKRRNVPVTVRIRRLMGLLRFLYALLKPSVAGISWILGIFGALFKSHGKPSRTSIALLVLASILSADLVRDDVFRANFYKRLRKGARPGVFFADTSQKIKAMIKKLPTVQNDYQVPGYLRALGGDITTVSFMLFGYRARDVPYRREHIAVYDEAHRVDRHFTLDWAFPDKTSTASCCCLLLAGIGGNSDSPYIRDVTARLVEDGMVVAVLLARGLGICTSTSTLDRIYNPTDDGDVHLAVKKLSVMFHKITVVGFSLGGVTTCRYFSATPENKIPKNVVGGVGVSGAFKIGFIDLPRYQNVYQEVLVPGLVDDICLKYGTELEERIGSVETLLSSRTYRDLHRELFTNARIPNVETDYDKWRQNLEACASRVHRPLLLLTALDDPLHHPEHLGLNRLWTENHQTESDPHPSDNLLVVVTDSGGHVAWPEIGFRTSGYSYLQRIVSEFCHAAIEDSE